MRKKSLKTVALAATTSMVLLSTANCFAATVSTKTEYNLNANTVKVTTTVTNMKGDGMVTYLLTKDSNAITSDNASSNILYIEQKSSASNGVSFEYTVPKAKFDTGLNSSLKMGSNISEDFSTIDQVRYAALNVTGADKAQVSLMQNNTAISDDKILGKGEQATLNVTAYTGYSIKSLTLDGNAVSNNSIITGTGAAMTLVVETEAVSSEPTIATVTATTNDTEFNTANAKFIAYVTANGKNVKYGAIVKHGSEEQKVYALKAAGTDASVSGSESAYFAMVFNFESTNFTDGEKGEYIITPFVEVDGETKATGNDVKYTVQ